MSNKPIGLLDLPYEILQRIYNESPNNLKASCKFFYIMYNDYYMNMFIDRFGPEILETMVKYDYKYLIDYIKSFDYWRGTTRKIISNYYKLPMPYDISNSDSITADYLNVQYIRDSWKLIYGIYVNRRIFVDYTDYKVSDNRTTKSININTKLKLLPGLYNLSCGLIIQNSAGMSTTIFEVINNESKEKLLDYQPPYNLNELVPMHKFVLLDIGTFEVKNSKVLEITEENISNNDTDKSLKAKNKQKIDKCNLIDISFIVKESDVFTKSGFIICYIDINAFQEKDIIFDKVNNKLVCKYEKYWFAWWVINDYIWSEEIVNILLKRLYKSINMSVNLIDYKNKRIGSISQSGQDEQTKCVENDISTTEIYDDSTCTYIDLLTYNQKFYSQFDKNGKPLVRDFKFISQLARRKYYDLKESKPNIESSTRYLNEPLKWKMATIMEIDK